MNLPHTISKSSLLSSLGVLVLTFGLYGSAFAANRATFSPIDLRFGGVQVGASETLAATLTNSGTSKLTVSSITSNHSAYTVKYPALPMTLNPGQGLLLNVTFHPAASGTQSGVIAIQGTSTSLAVHGWGAASKSLVSNPQSVAFGSVQSGSVLTTSVTMTNDRNGSVTISSDAIKGTGFAVQGLSLPLTLSAGESYTFKIAFSPQSVGSVIGSFQALNSNNTPILSVPLSGTGTVGGQLSSSPTSIAFGNVTVGSNSSKTGTLTAAGGSITVNSASSSSSEFVVSGISLPKTIAAGQSVSYSVTFAPTSSGTASGTVSFASTANSTSESMSGTGVAPVQHSVSLVWDPSTSQVSGYNVYRGTTSGGPYAKLTGTLDPGTTYLDTNVSASQTYYYVTTAVSTTGVESSYSNQVRVSVP